MYKMLIVDDEYLVRLGIEETINWEDYDIEIVGSAKNGKEGLNMALELLPDLIISDIKMPIMDGLEFTKAINDHNLDTVIIILSGYKDFEYAKETLENGAFHYLLKPIDNEQLVKSAVKALRYLAENRLNKKRIENIDKEKPLISTTIIQNLISGNYANINDLVEKIKLYNLKIPSTGIVVYSEIEQDNIYKQDVKRANTSFYDIVINKLKENDFIFNSIIFLSHFVILISEVEEEQIICLLNDCLKNYEQNHIELISIGISGKYNSYDYIYEMYLNSKKNAKNKLLLTINTITSNQASHIGYRKTVGEIIRYISTHYQDNLSIEKVAKRFDISQSHLMYIFKEDVGKTFNECLAEYRIKVAKKLMLSGKYRIYEIASMVGYPDTKYFSQVFRKFENLSPVEYVNKNIH